MDNSENRNNLPKHVPIDMAYVPEQKPYERTRVIHTNGKEEEHKLAQHSLSPEKLGVVGYVKDVAGFVKDAVQERRRRRSNSVSSIEEQQQQETQPPVEEEKPRRRSLESHSNSAFSDAVTGLFPGVHTIGDVNASGCTHADELRNQMNHINHDNKLL